VKSSSSKLLTLLVFAGPLFSCWTSTSAVGDCLGSNVRMVCDDVIYIPGRLEPSLMESDSSSVLLILFDGSGGLEAAVSVCSSTISTSKPAGVGL
jgi:hypothetical protein